MNRKLFSLFVHTKIHAYKRHRQTLSGTLKTHLAHTLSSILCLSYNRSRALCLVPFW